jgi:predicted 2-oxoglutarate/Fe(II)-dependent dioxygenase YbiX
MKRIVLYDKVHVYKEVFNDVGSSAKFFLENNNWENWGRWGRMSHVNNLVFNSENFPTEKEWQSYKNQVKENNKQSDHKEFSSNSEEIFDIFYKVTKDYSSFNSIDLFNWSFAPPSFCVYETKNMENHTKAMEYHTDYQQETAEQPGEKFAITCNFYLNDNYQGGEIMFKIYNKEKDCYETFEYHPEAGDVLVFPSTDPYLHGVRLMAGGEKMFIRSFWCYNFKGSESWWNNKKKYGNKAWSEMEKERAAKEASEIPTKYKRDAPTISIEIGDTCETI